MITVQWEAFDPGDEPVCGHGIEFHLDNALDKKSLIAFIDGFEWHHGSSDEMLVWIRRGLEATHPYAYATLHDAIDKAAASRDIISGKLSNRVVAWVNG